MSICKRDCIICAENESHKLIRISGSNRDIRALTYGCGFMPLAVGIQPEWLMQCIAYLEHPCSRWLSALDGWMYYMV